MPSLESRIKVLKDIASENGIVLQLEETTVSVEVLKLSPQNLQFLVVYTFEKQLLMASDANCSGTI